MIYINKDDSCSKTNNAALLIPQMLARIPALQVILLACPSHSADSTDARAPFFKSLY